MKSESNRDNSQLWPQDGRDAHRVSGVAFSLMMLMQFSGEICVHLSACVPSYLSFTLFLHHFLFPTQSKSILSSSLIFSPTVYKPITFCSMCFKPHLAFQTHGTHLLHMSWSFRDPSSTCFISTATISISLLKHLLLDFTGKALLALLALMRYQCFRGWRSIISSGNIFTGFCISRKLGGEKCPQLWLWH